MSELKSILLHLDAASNTTERLAFARRLAQAHGARVEAMYAVMPAVLQYPFAFTADGSGATLLMNYAAEQRARNRARRDPVPAAVIERMLGRWTVPDPTEAHELTFLLPSGLSS